MNNTVVNALKVWTQKIKFRVYLCIKISRLKDFQIEKSTIMIIWNISIFSNVIRKSRLFLWSSKLWIKIHFFDPGSDAKEGVWQNWVRARSRSALSSLDTNEGARFFLLSFATSLQNTQLVYWAEIDQHQPVDFFS